MAGTRLYPGSQPPKTGGGQKTTTTTQPVKTGGGKGSQPPGGAKGGGRRTPKARSDLYNRALNDVRTSFFPMLNQIGQSRLQAKQQYGEDSKRVGDIYGALQTQLQPLTGQYQDAVSGISGDLQSQLGTLMGSIGSNVQGVPQSEIGAGAGMLGSLGAGTLEQLASDKSRNAGYNTSAMRQGGIESMTAQRNYLQDFQNLKDQFQQQTLQIKAQMPAQIRSRVDALRDQQWQQHMAQLEYQLRAASINAANQGNTALANYYKNVIPGLIGPTGHIGGGKKPRRHPSSTGGGYTPPTSSKPKP